MSIESAEPNSVKDASPNSAADSSGRDDTAASSRQKAAATVKRRREERRAESLRQIRDQTADGSLVVRQMTAAQHEAASGAARETLARNAARGKRYKAPGQRES